MPSFDDPSPAVNQFTAYIDKAKTLYQVNLDKVTPFVTYRWAGFGIMLFLFLVRILVAQGWYIICYTLSIYLLSLFIQFLQPKFDVTLQQELNNESIEEGLTEEEKRGGDSGAVDDEFRPFIRRLPEFKFWHRAMVATTVSLFGSFFEIFNLPVFWPILLMYFIALFSFSMKKQIQHMIKYHYIPLDIGKAKYGKVGK
ncbi:protein retrieval receptor [Saccharomycopsis crataegensis]|uniref:Protein RER1 n=1 Tax=Saccharomycopsis crataegensis TaxID=43959 RepID=A0AAV5QQ03_9ASCO|nr:protein retrieval receptor [Saccharomycopsis crataegensis]